MPSHKVLIRVLIVYVLLVFIPILGFVYFKDSPALKSFRRIFAKKNNPEVIIENLENKYKEANSFSEGSYLGLNEQKQVLIKKSDDTTQALNVTPTTAIVCVKLQNGLPMDTKKLAGIETGEIYTLLENYKSHTNKYVQFGADESNNLEYISMEDFYEGFCFK